MTVFSSSCCSHPSTLSYSQRVPMGTAGFTPLLPILQLSGVQETQPEGFLWQLFLVFSTAGESRAQLPRELWVTQCHKNTAHPSLQERCTTLGEEHELFFPCSKGEGSRCGDLMMEERPLGKAPGQSRAAQRCHPAPAVPSCPGSQHTQSAVPPAPRFLCLWGFLNHVANEQECFTAC